MAEIIVRGIKADMKLRLQERASRHGQSMEAEIRDILRDAMKQDDPNELGTGTRIAARFREIGLGPDEHIPELRGEYPKDPFD